MAGLFDLKSLGTNLLGQGVAAVGNMLATKANNYVSDNGLPVIGAIEDRKVRLGALILLENLVLGLVPETFGPVKRVKDYLNGGFGVTNAQLLAKETGINIFEAANQLPFTQAADFMQQGKMLKAFSEAARSVLSDAGIADAKTVSDAEIVRLINNAKAMPGGLNAVLSRIKQAKAAVSS